MARIGISATKDYLVKDSKPFFLLSDTNWMMFQRLSIEESKMLANYRASQGFNALQISVLPISHDNSAGEGDIEPFILKDGKYDFDNINEEYFDKAEIMLQNMVDLKLVPFLHLFWANYIPDTWASKISPNTIIPFEKLDGICRYIIARFKKYNPIYSVSGDTNFETPEVEKYYLKILDLLLELDPQSITTLHLQPTADPTEKLCEHPQYHFYTYQSGHSVGRVDANGNKHCSQNSMMTFSEQFLNKPNKKPIINTEPCYDGHGHGCTYGRFKAFDIRKATWCSLLSGSKAGVTYGAHGVWQFHRDGMEFNNPYFSSMPFDWRVALKFRGAWDVSYAKWLFEHYNMFELNPCQRIINNPAKNIDDICLMRMSKTDDDKMVVIYAPYSDEIVVDMDLSEYTINMIDMENRDFIVPRMSYKDGKSTIHLSHINEDLLIIAQK